MTNFSNTPGLLNTALDRLILPGAAGFTRFGYEWRKRAWSQNATSLEGRTAVITGATSGLGFSAAGSLASLGARVVLIGRNAAKARKARQDIISKTGNQAVDIQVADLSVMSEVRDLAGRLLETEPEIHILVNNAAVLPVERTLTSEGLEHTFATNLLSPYLLTSLLTSRLQESAPSRIINVLSGGMYLSGLDVDDLQYEKSDFDGSRAYARTKRGLMVMTEYWAEEQLGSGVTVNAMHPGWADTPGVVNSLPAFHRLMKPLLRNPEQGADTIVWLASAPEVADKSGLFWLDREPHVTTVLPCTGGTGRQRRLLKKALKQFTG